MSILRGWKKDPPGRRGIGGRIDNRYEICQVLGGEGKSGMGILYLCHDLKDDLICILKTFQEKYVFSGDSQKLFEREALVWTELEGHPNILRAYWVKRMEGRLFIALEYVFPDEKGRNTLAHYLGDLTMPGILNFSIQFCYGMEYAYSKGIDAHRDIKPDNIMITADPKTVKITDFGLVKAFQEIRCDEDNISLGENPSLSIFRSKGRTVCGTVPYMAPEQFDGRQDRKSDIYSFGVCLYQMAANGKLPFISRDIEGWIRAHRDAPVPPISSPIFQIVKRCLEKDPQNRYQSFAQLREDLQGLALKEGMGKIAAPEVKKLEGWEWCHKGSSLHDLGRYSEALSCYDKAINIDPDDAMSWYNKGNTLKHLGRLDEAISCYDKAISCYDKTRETEPTIWAWNNKAQALNKLQRYEEAIRCCDKAIEIDPRDFAPWWNKGDALFHLRRYDEALISYSKALELNQEYADLWNDKGAALECLGRREEAVRHYDEALKIDPNYSLAMNNRNNCLKKLGK